MDFSFAICTYNCCDVLKESVGRLIDHLNKYALGNKWEILIIDNNSTDKTKKIIFELQKLHNLPSLKYFFEKRQGISFARNKALEKSKGDVIIFIDHDIFISGDWFPQAKMALKKYPNAAIIGGKILSLQALPKDKKWLLSLKEDNYFLSLALLDKGNKDKILDTSDFIITTANLIIRKKFINSIGKFNEIFGNGKGFLKIYSGEDIDFARRVVDKGFEAVYYPRLVVYHKLLSRRFTKNYSRWRYFQNGKEIANFDRIHNGKGYLISRFFKLMIGTPFDLVRIFSEYVFNQPQNFRYEAGFFYTLGYFIGFLSFFKSILK